MSLSPYQSLPLSKCTFHSICFTVDSDSNLRVLTLEDRDKGELVKGMSALELLDKSLKYNNHLESLANFMNIQTNSEAVQNGVWTKAGVKSSGDTGSQRYC
jgi:hypothetical protein